MPLSVASSRQSLERAQAQPWDVSSGRSLYGFENSLLLRQIDRQIELYVNGLIVIMGNSLHEACVRVATSWCHFSENVGFDISHLPSWRSSAALRGAIC